MSESSLYLIVDRNLSSFVVNRHCSACVHALSKSLRQTNIDRAINTYSLNQQRKDKHSLHLNARYTTFIAHCKRKAITPYT
jgi:hypothetical protein